MTGFPRLTMTIPEAGKLVANLERSASYEAAKRGEIPTVRIGGRMVVPIGTLFKMFGLEYSPNDSDAVDR